ncbi:hypothetical protein EBR66_01255 [bacterium]|nr:hypothetical protein [bacterium]
MKRILAVAILVPEFVCAQSLYQVWNVANLFSGILIVVSFIFFFGGFALYIARLGRTYRSEGIDLMQWGVSFLFVFLVLSTISRWTLLYPWAIPWVFALLIIGLFMVYILPELIAGGGEKKKEHD